MIPKFKSIQRTIDPLSFFNLSRILWKKDRKKQWPKGGKNFTKCVKREELDKQFLLWKNLKEVLKRTASKFETGKVFINYFRNSILLLSIKISNLIISRFPKKSSRSKEILKKSTIWTPETCKKNKKMLKN